ncbi:MAG: signaling recognition particle receptor family protein, partial [Emcibacteraceae bacterium]
MTEKKQKLGWFSRLKQGLKKSSSALTEGITGIFTKKRLDASTLEELEDLLIMSDLGVAVSARVCERLAKNRFDKSISAEEVQQALAEEIGEIMEDVAKPLEVNGENTPHVILMVGVNGAGKTTTIGKMAKQFKNQGKSVMLAAGDTFRAAATQQLQIWGQRNNIPVVVGKEGCDAAGLIYDAIEKARNTNTDILMVDTAGRLQNKGYLMDELKKIIRVISKFDQTAPHNTVLILDAT